MNIDLNNETKKDVIFNYLKSNRFFQNNILLNCLFKTYDISNSSQTYHYRQIVRIRNENRFTYRRKRQRIEDGLNCLKFIPDNLKSDYAVKENSNIDVERMKKIEELNTETNRAAGWSQSNPNLNGLPDSLNTGQYIQDNFSLSISRNIKTTASNLDIKKLNVGLEFDYSSYESTNSIFNNFKLKFNNFVKFYTDYLNKDKYEQDEELKGFLDEINTVLNEYTTGEQSLEGVFKVLEKFNEKFTIPIYKKTINHIPSIDLLIIKLKKL